MAIEKKTEFTTAEWVSIIKAIQSTETIHELSDIFAHEIGHTSAIRQIIPPIGSQDRSNAGRFYPYNIPDEFLGYLKKSYANKLGPILQYVLDTGHAVWLSDLIDEPIFVESGIARDSHKFMKLVVDGICVPSFNQSHWGYSFLSFGRPKEDFQESFTWQIQSICQHTHVRYLTLRNLFQNKVNFTNRELDVIELMAMGKSNTEIGLILNISVHTVNGYMRKIYLKLDVYDRVTATLRAISLNLIS